MTRRETKVAIKNRLEASGDWARFTALREQFKAEGYSATEAWQLAVQRFPPPDGTPDEAASLTSLGDVSVPEVRDGQARKSTKEMVDDLAYAVRDKVADPNIVIDWVGANIRTPWDKLSPKDVPSALAVNLLVDAKKNTAWFFTTYVKPKSESATASAIARDERSQMELLDAVRSSIPTR